MWLSERAGDRARPTAAAQAGYATLGGEGGAVYLDGERRAMAVYGPGGYQWSPAPGQEVLVLKNGGTGAAYCVAAARTAEGCRPGEVVISTPGGAAVKLGNDGTVELVGTVKLRGTVEVNGTALEELIASLVNTGGEANGADGA